MGTQREARAASPGRLGAMVRVMFRAGAEDLEWGRALVVASSRLPLGDRQRLWRLLNAPRAKARARHDADSRPLLLEGPRVAAGILTTGPIVQGIGTG